MISVVVPVYGVEKYIIDCLSAIENQTFRDFELILVDDDSKDYSIPLAEEYLKKTQLNWRILHQKNQGQGRARDFGIENASGQYVVCIDSDDTISPYFLELLYTQAQRTNADVCFCGYVSVSTPPRGQSKDKKEPEFKMIEKQDLMERFLCRTIAPLLPAMLMRRELLLDNHIKSATGCRFSEDVYFMWHLFATAEIVAYTDAPLYYYLVRQGSTMAASSMERIYTGYSAFLSLAEEKTMFKDFPKANYILPRWVLGALRASARILSYPDFSYIANRMDYRKHMKQMHHFPEKKAKILSKVLEVSPRIFWCIVWAERRLR